MPTPMAPRIILTHNTRGELPTLLRAHTTPQTLALRARLILRAAAVDQPPTRHISRALGCANLTVGKGRRRSLAQGLAGCQDAGRPGRPTTIASPTRGRVMAVASTLPPDQDRTVTRGTLEEIATAVLETLGTDAMSRSSVWRILAEVDLKPHQSAYWLQSHAADCEAKAHRMCPLYVGALAAYAHGRLVICCDEKSGIQGLERQAPTTAAKPGQRARREHEYIRHGTRVLLHSLAVATGPLAWTRGATRTAADVVTHLTQAYQRLPRMQRYDWVMENLHTPWSLEVCRVVARWCHVPCALCNLKTGPQRRALLTDSSHRHVFHCTPKHGSWLTQAEFCFGTLQQRFLAVGV